METKDPMSRAGTPQRDLAARADFAASFAALRAAVWREKPLIHCLTHPITMNDSANVVLALGASPNMASHPDEVVEAVRGADALAVNLGNITDERMEAMERAGGAAREKGIPVLLDAVGVGFSTLRRRFAAHFIEAYRPAIVKGNASELRILCGLASHGRGVDAGPADAVGTAQLEDMAALLQKHAVQWRTVLLLTGATDLIVSPARTAFVRNGTPVLARLTGTGCMAGAMAATWLAVGTPWEAAVLACVTMGMAGWIAEQAAGKGPDGRVPMGAFHMALLDALSTLSDETLASGMEITVR